MKGFLSLDLNVSRELLDKTRFNPSGSIRTKDRGITLVYDGENVVRLSLTKPYSHSVLNEELFKKVDGMVKSNNNLKENV